MNIIDYDILWGLHHKDLIEKVKIKILEQWQPLGGVSVTGSFEVVNRKVYGEIETIPLYCQAMIKVKE